MFIYKYNVNFILTAGILFLIVCVGCKSTGDSPGGWKNLFAPDDSKQVKAEAEVMEHITSAEKYLQNKKNLEAREEYLKVLAIYEKYPEITKRELPYCRLGVIAEDLRMYETAEKYYRQAIALNLNTGEPYNNLGFCLLTQKKYEEAIINLKKAVDLKPSERKYHNNLALAYGAVKNYDKAYEHFRIAGSEADACYNMSSIFALEGREAEAVQALKRAVMIDPQHKSAARMLATYQEYERNPEYFQNDYHIYPPGGMVDYKESAQRMAAEASAVSEHYGTEVHINK
ncbi:MAG: tetratricopeptide repeat protein [Planctomycetia bacterium]|nr:tetratricopeptide repeat protein [Planctomycetia bacterium]